VENITLSEALNHKIFSHLRSFISYLYEWDVQQTVALPLGLGSVHVETHTTEQQLTNKRHYAVRH